METKAAELYLERNPNPIRTIVNPALKTIFQANMLIHYCDTLASMLSKSLTQSKYGYQRSNVKMSSLHTFSKSVTE